jgi:hypothetical protein
MVDINKQQGMINLKHVTYIVLDGPKLLWLTRRDDLQPDVLMMIQIRMLKVTLYYYKDCIRHRYSRHCEKDFSEKAKLSDSNYRNIQRMPMKRKY